MQKNYGRHLDNKDRMNAINLLDFVSETGSTPAIDSKFARINNPHSTCISTRQLGCSTPQKARRLGAKPWSWPKLFHPPRSVFNLHSGDAN